MTALTRLREIARPDMTRAEAARIVGVSRQRVSQLVNQHGIELASTKDAEHHASPDITPELLRQLLRYEPETGRLFWRERPRWMFPTAHSHRTWNTRHAGKEAFATDDGRGYRHGSIFGTSYRAHRVIWAIVHGAHPDGHIDHENGVRSDNRLANLREVSPGENQQNMKRSVANSSGVTGVHWHKALGKWGAAIGVGGKARNLGVFDDFYTAVAARKEAERALGYHPNHGRPA